ncbi:MAG TPA: hypothetical protein VGO63_03000 [Candidatus Paceibacterota bacterium]|nr:hypothetical protein [Candidatus Paceibacterota bacterium]
MNKNKKIGLGVVGVLVLVGIFYGGVVYGKYHSISMNNRAKGSFAAFGQMGGTRGMRVSGNFGGFANGEILSKDDKSITIKLMDGGSRIVFLDTNTKIAKSTEGSVADLAVGTSVSVTGAANTDGSVNAQMIQIRPAMQKTVIQ